MKHIPCYLEQILLVNEKKIVIEGWIATKETKIDIFLDQNGKKYSSNFLTLYPREDVAKTLEINLKDAKGFYCVFEDISNGLVCVHIKSEEQEVYCKEIKPIPKREEEILKFIDSISYNIKEQELKIRGWAFCKFENQPVKVNVYSKGKLLAELYANKVRNDVHTTFQRYESSLYCGFSKVISKEIKANKISLCFISKKGKKEWIHTNLNQEKQSKIGILTQSIIKFYRKIKREKLSLKQIFKEIKITLDGANNEVKKASLKKEIVFHKKEEVWEKNNQCSNSLKEELITKIEDKSIGVVIKVKSGNNLYHQIESINNQYIKVSEVLLLVEDNNQKEIFQQYEKENKVFILTIQEAYLRISNWNIKNILFMQEGIILDETMVLQLLFENSPIRFDIVYSDSRFYNGKLNFKPDWSPEHILSCNYIGNCILTTKSLLVKIWGQQLPLNKEIIYDFILRAFEMNIRIGHIAKVLYKEEKSEDLSEDYKNQKSVLEEYFRRRKLDVEINKNIQANQEEYPIFSIKFLDEGEKVDIIIPTKNGKDILSRCISSLEKTSYKNFVITIIDNASDDPEMLEYLKKIQSDKIRVRRIENESKKGFSYSYINNQAALQSDCEYLLFLNNDTEIITKDWLSCMVGYLNINQVGIVGAKLLFPDDTIQHAGIIMGLHDKMAGPAFKLLSIKEKGYLNFENTTRNYSAVTAACLLIRKKDFFSVGMFDNKEFSVAYNDLDLCMKVIRQLKKTNVFVAEAMLYHYEGATRGYVDKIEETVAFREKYKTYKDSYYNCNLSTENEYFELSTACTLTAPKLRIPKVMFVLHNLNYEGAPLQMLEIAKGLSKQGKISVEIAAALDGKLTKKIKEEFNINPVIIPCEVKKLKNYREYEEIVKQYMQSMKEKRIDLVVANTIECFFAVEAAKQLGVKAIWAIHESVDCFQYFSSLNWKIQQSYLNCYSYVYRLIFCAKATQVMYKDVDVNYSSETIHNGVVFHKIEEYKKKYSISDAKKHLSISEDTLMVLVLGNTCIRKGQLDFVKSVKRLKEELPKQKMIFYIVGGVEGEYLEEIQDYIIENQLQKDVIIIMQTDQTEQYYRASDIFVCTSYNESYPRVILEAMAFELPIVTTPVFGITEQVYENVNGYFFSPGDIETMTEKIKQLICNPECRKTFSTNSKTVLRFINSYEEMIEKYSQVIQQAWISSYRK